MSGRGLDEPPPILGSWGRLYLLVAALLLADVVLGYLLTRWAA